MLKAWQSVTGEHRDPQVSAPTQKWWDAECLYNGARTWGTGPICQRQLRSALPAPCKNGKGRGTHASLSLALSARLTR